MTEKNKNQSGGVWGIVGKISVAVAAILGLIQLWKVFFDPKEHSGEASGSYVSYYISPKQRDAITSLYKYNAAFEAVKHTPLYEKKQLEPDSLVKYFDSLPDNYSAKSIYNQIQSSKAGFSNYLSKGSMWEVTIRNTGSNTIDDINLELGFSGSFIFRKQNNSDTTGEFNGRIELGDLRPSYEIKVTCWGIDQYSNNEQYAFRSRVTHKNGWFPINYPKKAEGIWGWIIQKEEDFNLLTIIFIMIVVIIFLLISERFRLIENNKSKEQNKKTEQAETKNNI